MGGDEDANDGLRLENEQGALDQGDVDRAIEANFRAFTACYDRAGEARKYASGQVNLKFIVAQTGTVSDVLVTDSTLGNYQVERCLVVEGRKLKLRPTGGERETDFNYSLTFRSTGEVSVTEWEPEHVSSDMAALAAGLGSCERPTRGRLRAVVYFDSDGSVASAGLSAENPLDPTAALCVVERLQAWRLKSGAGHMVRTSFFVPRGEKAGARAAKSKGAIAKRVTASGRRARH